MIQTTHWKKTDFSFLSCMGKKISVISPGTLEVPGHVMTFPFTWLCVCVCAQLCLTLCNPMDYSPPDSSSMGFSRQEHQSGLPFPVPGNLPDQGIEPVSLVFPASMGRFLTLCHLGSLHLATSPLIHRASSTE